MGGEGREEGKEGKGRAGRGEEQRGRDRTGRVSGFSSQLTWQPYVYEISSRIMLQIGGFRGRPL